MKKPKDVSDLAARLTAGATRPLQSIAPEVTPAPAPAPAAPVAAAAVDSAPAAANSKAKRGSVSVFLRLPSGLHGRVADIATERTRQTGKGVTVQQVILEYLERSL